MDGRLVSLDEGESGGGDEEAVGEVMPAIDHLRFSSFPRLLTPLILYLLAFAPRPITPFLRITRRSLEAGQRQELESRANILIFYTSHSLSAFFTII